MEKSPLGWIYPCLWWWSVKAPSAMGVCPIQSIHNRGGDESWIESMPEAIPQPIGMDGVASETNPQI